MLRRHHRISLVFFAALTVALAACGDDPDRGDGGTSMGGQAGAGASSGATGGTGTGTGTSAGGTGASSTGGTGGTGGITTCGDPDEHSGEATYYDFADGSGNCSFDPTPGDIQYKFKEGSNQWWTAVQLRNHRHAILSFEYDSGGGNWVDVGRLDYNYFVEDSGMGPGPYSFRVTDVYGNTLEDHGIGFIEGGVVDGAAQFPSCGD